MAETPGETAGLYPAQQPSGSRHPRFPHLFSPLQVGRLPLKNRIVNSPHATGFVKDGLYTDQLVAYHRERARGGAALIESQATSVSADYGDLRSSDAIIPWYHKVAEAVHPYGARYFAELSHSGRQAEWAGDGAEVLLAPSPVPQQMFGWRWRVPHELETAQIRQIIADYRAAAARARKGGLDGIDLHCAHGNLMEQFMSPLLNQRTDEWGGSLENRTRFAREVIYAVREAVGRDLVVGCRFTGAELDQGGLSHEEMIEIARRLDELNLLDFFSISMGHYSDLLNNARNIPDMSFERGLWRPIGAGFKEALQAPVFLVGRINNPALAEELLAAGACDQVVMARALIADPYLPAKAFADRAEDIRICVGAVEGCWGHREQNRGITCIYNPVTGREGAWGGEIPRTSQPRTVVVVGGGPSGLECARVAAERGHRVTLLERADELGGQVLLAAKAPQRAEIGEVARWLQRQCENAGVEFRLHTEATVEGLLALRPDVVVVATGSRSGALPGQDGNGGVIDLRAVLAGEASAERRVLVVDETGMWPGFSVAGYLAARGHEVELVTPMLNPGQNIEPTSWRMAYERLLRAGVKFRPLTAVAAVGDRQVTVRHVYTGAEDTVAGFDTLVTAMAPQADDALYRALQGNVERLYLVGDAVAPRGIEEAVYDGHKVAREI